LYDKTSWATKIPFALFKDARFNTLSKAP